MSTEDVPSEITALWRRIKTLYDRVQHLPQSTRPEIVEILDGVSAIIDALLERKAAAEEQLRASLQSKDVLLKEMHHRMKNNLQIVASLLQLQSSNCPDRSEHDLFEESHRRIRAMAFVYEKLFRSPGFPPHPHLPPPGGKG